jgi:RPM1-interacting protein 4
MARPHVPKFGTWDVNGGNGAAYTAAFDPARADRGQKLINPNDPAENPDRMGGPAPHYRRAANGSDENRPRHERRSCREDLDVRRSSDPLGRQASSYDHPAARRTPGGPLGREGAEPPQRRTQAERDGDGSGPNPERSPAHHQANRMREAGRGAASPAWDRRGRHPSGGDEGSVLGAGTPKTRLRPQGGREELPAKGGALPKFGAWDVKDPNAGDGFTMIFQKLSNEKKEGGPVHIPRLNSDQPPSLEGSCGQQSQPGVPRKMHNKPANQPACCTVL